MVTLVTLRHWSNVNVANLDSFPLAIRSINGHTVTHFTFLQAQRYARTRHGLRRRKLDSNGHQHIHAVTAVVERHSSVVSAGSVRVCQLVVSEQGLVS